MKRRAHRALNLAYRLATALSARNATLERDSLRKLYPDVSNGVYVNMPTRGEAETLRKRMVEALRVRGIVELEEFGDTYIRLPESKALLSVGRVEERNSWKGKYGFYIRAS